MQSVAEVSRLIDRIYAAAETGGGWQDCLGTVRQALDATSAHLLYYLPASTDVVLMHASLDPAAIEAYQHHFCHVDPWEARLPAHSMTVGRVLPSSAVLPHNELKKTEFYADFGRRFGATRTLFGVTGHNADGSHLAVSVNRADSQSDFDDEAIAYLSALIPHLGRALHARSLWDAASSRCSAAENVLDALPCGVVLVDAHAFVCFANRQAANLLAKRDGIATDSGRLRGATTTSTRTLRDACAEIAATRGVVPRRAGATLNLPRASGAQPLQVLITPTTTGGATWSVPGRTVSAVIYITDPSEAPLPNTELLRDSFGLTPAESRVAALVAVGRTLEEIADELRYTRETTRWYVKQLLAKTHCRSRAEFAALAARSIAMFRTR